MSKVVPAMPEPVPGTRAPPLPFSDELRVLSRQFAGRPVRLSELLAATQGRGFDLLLLLLGVPFLTPVPLPGLSSLFGIVVLFIGARQTIGRRPWLPEKILHRQLPAPFIARLLAAAGRLVRWLEFLLRPRMDFLHQPGVYRRIAGTLIMLSGLLLLLPIPIPQTNTLPALTVVLLAAGAMERDGLFFLAGCAAFVVTLAWFGLLAFGGAHFLDNLWHRALGA